MFWQRFAQKYSKSRSRISTYEYAAHLCLPGPTFIKPDHLDPSGSPWSKWKSLLTTMWTPTITKGNYRSGNKPLSETMMVILPTHICVTRPQRVNTLRPRQNGLHFPYNIFKCTFLNENVWISINKANLRDLIAATGLVILLKLDLNRRFFSPCHLEIWWMTPKKQ